MQKDAYYITVINTTVMVRLWGVENAMELHSLPMHSYYLKKRVWEFLYPGTFFNVVSAIHFYQRANPQRYSFCVMELDGSVCDSPERKKRTSSSTELSYRLDVHYQHKGIMQQAVCTLCEEAFDVPQVFSIYVLVEKRNTASMHALEANGFQREELGKLYMLKKYKWDMYAVLFHGLYMRKCKQMKQCRREDKECLNLQVRDILFSCISPICEKSIESYVSSCIH